ncbi:hypothetical protein CIW54_10560 [Paraburkholderia sp. T12-10]|nr:hypothetical protein CIW54_10560 [Paraburkholderia sp. T12-10]
MQSLVNFFRENTQIKKTLSESLIRYFYFIMKYWMNFFRKSNQNRSSDFWFENMNATGESPMHIREESYLMRKMYSGCLMRSVREGG